eukprot:2102090-Ditylum_brightwellii.AAC.1
MPRRCIKEPTQVKQYAKLLREMMSSLCNRPYPEAHEFSIQELEHLTPHDIYRWMARRVYGTDDSFT